MSDFSHVDIRRLDFMLLLVLREGVRRRKLSEVAEVLGVTQAAISHSVGRLRDLFDDELFLRRPHGVEPTARALALAAQAEDILEAAGALLAPPPRFDPARDTRVVRLCALDYEVALLTAALEPILAEAPGLRLPSVARRSILRRSRAAIRFPSTSWFRPRSSKAMANSCVCGSE